ncbi:Flocculation suppression protein [Emydomyces testavorans]|uniref:Flocculation suppression protein n=1 Tax=Emydomyces testavorans TaxID=2070801 RepID=A0AAF0DIH6_9EURO|nr:Flocculation suppression protein [Emydomyces testavorans]
MNRVLEPPSRNPFTGPVDMSTESRSIPVLSASISPSDPMPGDPMDVSPPASAAMGPPSQSSPEVEQGPTSHTNGNTGESGASQNTAAGQPTGAAAAAQQPKVVQTAFIHKLYR